MTVSGSAPVVTETSADPVERYRFGALQSSPVFRRLWLSTLSASLGQWMQATALGWLALDLTDSASFVGLVAFASGLPFLVISLPGGMLIDRFDRQKVLIAGQSLAAMLAVLLSIDVIFGHVEPWHLLIAAFANGSIQSITNPTQQSLVPSLVPKDSLTNAIGLMSAGQNMTRVVGPTIAGLLIGLVGTSAGFICQAIALLISVSLIATTTFPTRIRTLSARSISGMLEGVKLVASRPDLRSLFLMVSIATFFVFPYISFLSVFARDVFETGPGGLGILMASSGLGAVAGSIYVATRSRKTTGTLLAGQMTAYGLVIVGFAVSPAFLVALPFLFAAGFLGSSFMSANNALIQHRIEDSIRGRVIAVYMLTWGLMPLGALPMGILSSATSTPLAVALGASISSALTILLYFKSPAIREI